MNCCFCNGSCVHICAHAACEIHGLYKPPIPIEKKPWKADKTLICQMAASIFCQSNIVSEGHAIIVAKRIAQLVEGDKKT